MRHSQVVAPSSGTRHRPELQGLRALAVALVVVYHVWIGRVSGGVDVFFVITGFLLIGQLVRAAERDELSLRERWSRIAARLVPSAAVVLIAIVIAGAVVLPPGRWAQNARESVAAGLFAENWHLAHAAVDYAARSASTSMVQHFWSLSVQGQVFLLFPLLVVAVSASARDRGEVRGRVTLLLLGIFVASLAYSVAATAVDQPRAYFDTLARLWEFALGGLATIGIDRLALRRTTRIALGWVGVIGLVVCGMVLQVDAVFPGWVALWPAGCAVLVLVAGHTRSRWAADRLLTGRIAHYVGDLSYPLYLWHWPLLIGTLAVTGEDHVDPATGIAIVAAALALAHITHGVVGQPAATRPRTPGRRTRVAATATAAALLAAVAWQGAAQVRAHPVGQIGDLAHPGAYALLGDADAGPLQVELLPPPAAVTEDWHHIEQWDCTPLRGFPMDSCTQPLPSGAQTGPARRIAIVGDSHVQQLSAALVPLARANNWQLIEIVRGACPFSTASETDPDDAECTAWLAAAYDTILDLRPDAVITLASRDVRIGLTETTPPGFVEQWRRLDAEHIPVLAVRDNPRFATPMPDCVSRNGNDPMSCGADRADLYSPEPPWTRVADLPANVAFVDTADAICLPRRCPAVIGNVLVYLDDNHLTATYAASMAPLIESQVHAGLGW